MQPGPHDDYCPTLTRLQRAVLNSVDNVLDRESRAIARAITLIESTKPADAMVAGELLRKLRAAKAQRRAATGLPPEKGTELRRIAITGSPGAGKSCFIEALGMYLVDTLGLTVGVIAVDPSSVITKGSILGDKTRMERLSVHPKAYVRPSPSKGHLGGVQARCWEVMELLECASFDVIIVETVGVGQSEIAAKQMTDVFTLLVPPASGDELQGVKKGIVEVADAILVTKNDGDREKLAKQTKLHYLRAVGYSAAHGEDTKPVHCISSETNKGIAEAWELIDYAWKKQKNCGLLEAQKKAQAMQHFHSYFELELVLRANEMLESMIPVLEDRVVAGKLSPREAAEEALAKVLHTASPPDIAGHHHHPHPHPHLK